MKIELKLNNDALIAVHRLLQKIYNTYITVSKSESVYKSIGFDLAGIFEKKYKSKIKSQDLFDQKKLTKITLKYHEGWGLKQLLIDMLPLVENDLHRNHIQRIINKLDQKGC